MLLIVYRYEGTKDKMTLEGAMLSVIDEAMGGTIRLTQPCAITDDCTVNVQRF